MRKIIIFICTLLVFVSCCKSTEYHQATVTFTDGTTKVYKITRWLDSDDNKFRLMTIDGEMIYLTDVKEVSIKTLINHKPQY
jgi:major membrane immunogen (membrane-anchored lipoprotein)